MALTVIKPSGIDATGEYTVTGMTVSANLTSANANIANLVTSGNINFSNTSNVTLGPISNLHISGGTSGYVLSTDGSGNLSWVAQSGGSSSGISNGTSNVNIATSGGNVTVSVAGNANVLSVSGTGMNITGNILPTAANTYSLGSSTYYFKDAYIGPGSLYINGQKVLEQQSNTIVVTADLNQNVRLETTGTGQIELLPANSSVIAIKGTLQLDASKTITSSDGNRIQFSDVIAVDALTALSANTDLVITSNGTGVVKVDDEFVVTGNLTVQGTTSNLSVTNLVVQDNIIDINAETTGIPTSNAGIRVVRGDEAATQLKWVEGSLAWQFTNDGTNYMSLVGRDSSGNTSLGNVGVANYFAGTLITGAQPNITSTGTLTSLTVGPNGSIILSGTTGYLKANTIQGRDGTTGIVLYNGSVPGAVGINTDLTVGASGTGNATINGNVTSINATLGNLTTSNYFAGTLTTASQPNITSTGTLAGITGTGTINFTGASNVSLGAVGNLKITGGTANYVLSTDGVGNLSWVAQSGGGGGGSNISNGTSNVNIAAADGNITMGVGGTANVVTVATTGVVVAGTISSNANITASRIISNVATGTAPFVVTSTTQVANLNAATAGTVTSGSQPNIASVGTLSSLTVSGNITGNSAIFAKSIVANAISSNSYIAAPTPYLNNGSGELKSLSTTTVGTTPSEVKIHPSGRFLYVANFSSNTVSMYSIGAGGVLTSIGTAVATGTSPTSIAIDPTGRFLYVTNAGSNTVSQFSINISTGALTSITTAIATQTQPWTITCDPTGRFAYVVTYAGGVSPTYVNMYSINSSTGALTTITSAISVTASGTWPGITVEPTGRFVYILVAQTVYTYTISQTTGGLTFSTSLALTGIAGAGLGIVAHPAGNLLYINAESDALILVLSINTYTGDLTQQYSISTGSPTGTGVTNQFSTIAVGLGGSVLYTLNRDNTYSVFTISTITGYLTKTLTNVSTSTLYPAGVSVSSDGKYVAIVTQASNTLTMYATESFNAYNVSAYGNITAGNIIANTQLVSSVATGTAPFIVTSTTQVANLNAATAGTVRTAAQPNITSTGNLTGLTVSNATGVVNFTNTANVTLGAVANLHISGGTSGYVLSTDGAGTLSWVAQSGGGGGGASIANGTSNVNIATANGNVTISSAGTANVVVVSSTSANVTGELNVSGNVTSNGIRLGYLGAPLSGSDKTTSYTLATPTDLGKIVTVGTGGSITIPNSTFSAGDTIGLYNNTAATVTVTCSTTNAYIAGTDTNKTSVTLAARGLATIVFISGTLCVISGSVT